MVRFFCIKKNPPKQHSSASQKMCALQTINSMRWLWAIPFPEFGPCDQKQSTKRNGSGWILNRAGNRKSQTICIFVQRVTSGDAACILLGTPHHCLFSLSVDVLLSPHLNHLVCYLALYTLYLILHLTNILEVNFFFLWTITIWCFERFHIVWRLWTGIQQTSGNMGYTPCRTTECTTTVGWW